MRRGESNGDGGDGNGDGLRNPMLNICLVCLFVVDCCNCCDMFLFWFANDLLTLCYFGEEDDVTRCPYNQGEWPSLFIGASSFQKSPLHRDTFGSSFFSIQLAGNGGSDNTSKELHHSNLQLPDN